MSEINLTYCPEGGEHDWTIWTNLDLVIDCDKCHHEAYRSSFPSARLGIAPLPVELFEEGSMLFVKPRREA